LAYDGLYLDEAVQMYDRSVVKARNALRSLPDDFHELIKGLCKLVPSMKMTKRK
jgi:hypothetical protein